MATQTTFYSTPVIASGIVPGTLDTSLTAPTNVTTIATGAASGTMFPEVVFIGLGTTVAGRVNLFLFDGTTYRFYDQMMIFAVTPSTTLEVFRQKATYDNLILPNASWTLVATVMDAGNVSLIRVTAIGGSA